MYWITSGGINIGSQKQKLYFKIFCVLWDSITQPLACETSVLTTAPYSHTVSTTKYVLKIIFWRNFHFFQNRSIINFFTYRGTWNFGKYFLSTFLKRLSHFMKLTIYILTLISVTICTFIYISMYIVTHIKVTTYTHWY